jgi:hypothetical protein
MHGIKIRGHPLPKHLVRPLSLGAGVLTARVFTKPLMMEEPALTDAHILNRVEGVLKRFLDEVPDARNSSLAKTRKPRCDKGVKRVRENDEEAARPITERAVSEVQVSDELRGLIQKVEVDVDE